MNQPAAPGRIRQTVKHSAIYAFGTMLRRITGLVMLPIYTQYLTPADYGAVELLTMAIELVGILIGLRISQAMFRYYILAEDEEARREVVSTVLTTVLVTSVLAACVLFLAAEPVSRLLFGNAEYIYEFQLFSFTLIANAGSAVGLSYLRARQMPAVFVCVGAASLLLQVGLNIYFVVMLELHVTGVVYSALISGLVLMFGLSLYMYAMAGFHYSLQLAGKLLRFVHPLIIASLGAFYAAYADKYFLRVFGSLSDVGLYTLAARVSSILATLYEAFNMSWGADRFDIVKRDNAREVFEKVFRYLAALFIVAGCGLAIFAHDFFIIMTQPEFYPAASIVPLLVVAMLARSCMIFTNFGALYMERTSVIAQASWIKAGLATVGYVSLIPLLGVYGAASTLMLASIVETVWVHTRSRRLYDMGLRWTPVLLMFVIAMIVVAAAMLTPQNDLAGFVIRVVVFLAMIVTFYLLPIWDEEERAVIRSGIGGVLRRIRSQRMSSKR